MGRSRQMPESERQFLLDLLEKSKELENALADAEAEVARLTAQLRLIEQARLAEVIPGGAFQMAESWMTRALHAETQVAQLHREAERSLSASKLTRLAQKMTNEACASITIAPYRKRAAKDAAQ